MSRKNILKYVMIDNQDGSVSFDTKSTPTCIDYQDNLSFQILWTGTLQGQLKVFVSNDKVDPKLGQQVTNWSELDFGTSIILDSSNSDIIININQNPFSFIALEWNALSGTGNIFAQLTSRMVGG